MHSGGYYLEGLVYHIYTTEENQPLLGASETSPCCSFLQVFFIFFFFSKCPHPILIPDCCSTSSSCGVQRLSNADWPTLLLKYTGCNAKRVPPKLTRVWVPSFFIEYDYVPCSTERGGAQFTPAPVWLKPPPHYKTTWIYKTLNSRIKSFPSLFSY